MINRKKYWLAVACWILSSVCLFVSGFLLAHHLVIQRTSHLLDECAYSLATEAKMLNTWCTSDTLRIGQCEDEIYVCLCSAPEDFKISSE